jgi:O-antigen/teichoic acid export membrane protein
MTEKLASKVARRFVGFDFARLKTGSVRGTAAIMDQGLFSSTNFIVNILLARWLNIESYGAFAVAFTVLLIFSTFHSALILEPLSALGPARYQHDLPSYFGVQIKLHGIISGMISLALITAAGGLMLWRPDDSLGLAMLGAALTFPFALLIWLMRRFFYVLHRPAGALWGSGLYFIICLGGIFFLHHIGEISPFTGFITLGLSSLISGALSLLALRNSNSGGIKFGGLPLLPVLRTHWDYGRWFVAQAVLGIFIYQAPIFLGAAFLGLEGAGVFRAMQNFALPMTQIVTAVMIFGIPSLSAEFGRGNLLALRNKGFLITATLIAIAGLYEVMLFFGYPYLERILYAGKFAPYAWMIPVLGLVPLASAVASGCQVALRALQKPQYFFYVGLATTPVAILSMVILTLWWGIGGLAASMVLTVAFSSLLTSYFYRSVVLK